MEAAANLEATEARLGRSDADVASQCQLEATGQRPAVDRADDRLVDAVQAPRDAAEPRRCVGAYVEHLPIEPRGNVFLEIGAGAERVTLPRQDGDVDVAVV